MADFSAIDATATAADQPLHTALVQQIRENSVAAIEDRLPRCVATYYKQTPLRLVGAPGWENPATLKRVLHPYLWRRSHRDVTQIKVTALIDVVGATTEIGALVLPASEINSVPEIADWDSIPNADQADASTATPIDVYLTLTLPDTDDDLFVVWFAVRSAATGSGDEIVKTSDSSPPADFFKSAVITLETASVSDTSGTLSTSRPTWLVALQEPSKTGGLGYVEAAPRQAVYLDLDGTDPCVVVYPPYDGITNLNTTYELHYQGLSYVDVYSVEIEESSIRLTQATSGLNAGEAPHVAVHTQTTTIQSQAFHATGGRVRSIRPPVQYFDGPSSSGDNLDLQLNDTLNRSHSFVRYDGTDWQTVASCPIGDGSRFRDYDGSTTYRKLGYEVHALLAIAGLGLYELAPGRSYSTAVPEFGLKARLVTTPTDTESNTTVAVGDTFDFGKVPVNTFPIGDMSGGFGKPGFHPVGYLLRLHHFNDEADQSQGSPLSHSLLGGFPEDVWNTGRYALATLFVKESSTSTIRGLELQVQGYAEDEPSAADFGTSPVAPFAFVHCLAWCARDIVTTDADLLNWSS